MQSMQAQRRCVGQHSGFSALKGAGRKPCIVQAAKKATKPQPAKPEQKGFGKAAPPPPAYDERKPCPCGTGKAYGACCHRIHSGKLQPSSAEHLLRARYSAYTIKIPDYIVQTTHPESPEFLGSADQYMKAVKQTQKRADYKGLEILDQEEGGSEAAITFRTTFVDKLSNDKQTSSERSTFVREKGTWLYMASCPP